MAASKTLGTDRAEQAECRAKHEMGFGAGDGSRTRDIQLGRLTLYRLSYSRSVAFVVRLSLVKATILAPTPPDRG